MLNYHLVHIGKNQRQDYPKFVAKFLWAFVCHIIVCNIWFGPHGQNINSTKAWPKVVTWHLSFSSVVGYCLFLPPSWSGTIPNEMAKMAMLPLRDLTSFFHEEIWERWHVCDLADSHFRTLLYSLVVICTQYTLVIFTNFIRKKIKLSGFELIQWWFAGKKWF